MQLLWIVWLITMMGVHIWLNAGHQICHENLTAAISGMQSWRCSRNATLFFTTRQLSLAIQLRQVNTLATIDCQHQVDTPATASTEFQIVDGHRPPLKHDSRTIACTRHKIAFTIRFFALHLVPTPYFPIPHLSDRRKHENVLLGAVSNPWTTGGYRYTQYRQPRIWMEHRQGLTISVM